MPRRGLRKVMSRHFSAAILATLLVTGLGSLAHAGTRPVSHEGWLLGLVLGRGGGDFSLTSDELSAVSGWSSGGLVVRGRAGRYLTEDLLLTAEYGVWRRSALDDSTGTEEAGASEPGFDGPVDRYIGSGVVAINLYPRLAGFMLRAGLGWGRIYAEVESGGSTLGEYSSGPLLLMGAAYEFALDPDLSMVVGADAGRVETSNGISGNFLQYYAAFQVHLDRLLPRNWF